MARGRKKVSTTFILQGIDVEELLLSNYQVGPKDTKKGDEDVEETDTIIDIGDKEIGITEILHEKSKRSIFFLDPNKHRVKYWVNMIDITQNGALPRYITKPCWWCRATFKSRPLGCPIEYHSHKTEGLDKERFEEKLKAANLPIDTNDFFETEGIFCMFPCIKAYALQQMAMTKSAKYKKTLTLITTLHLKIFGKLVTIPTADTWKVQREWGGHLTSEQYRASVGRLHYEETANLRRPYMYSSSLYIRETRVLI